MAGLSSVAALLLVAVACVSTIAYFRVDEERNKAVSLATKNKELAEKETSEREKAVRLAAEKDNLAKQERGLPLGGGSRASPVHLRAGSLVA